MSTSGPSSVRSDERSLYGHPSRSPLTPLLPPCHSMLALPLPPLQVSSTTENFAFTASQGNINFTHVKTHLESLIKIPLDASPEQIYLNLKGFFNYATKCNFNSLDIICLVASKIENFQKQQHLISPVLQGLFVYAFERWLGSSPCPSVFMLLINFWRRNWDYVLKVTSLEHFKDFHISLIAQLEMLNFWSRPEFNNELELKLPLLNSLEGNHAYVFDLLAAIFKNRKNVPALLELYACETCHNFKLLIYYSLIKLGQVYPLKELPLFFYREWYDQGHIIQRYASFQTLVASVDPLEPFLSAFFVHSFNPSSSSSFDPFYQPLLDSLAALESTAQTTAQPLQFFSNSWNRLISAIREYMPDERTLAEFMILILSICSDKPAYVNLTLTGMSVLYQCVSEEFFCLAKSQSGKLRPLFYPFWIAQIINEGWCRSQETLVLAKQVKSLYMRHGAANQTNSNV